MVVVQQASVHPKNKGCDFCTAIGVHVSTHLGSSYSAAQRDDEAAAVDSPSDDDFILIPPEDGAFGWGA
jgi:hypothetical protein